MTRFDRYMIGQLVRLFGLFGLILIGIYWVNRAVILFDKLIADGQSTGLFLEMTLLILPSMMMIVVPFAAFAAALSATNRLHVESELTILRSAGVSPWRLARPVAMFGGIVMAFMLLLGNVIAPISETRLAVRTTEIARNQTVRLLTPGSFTQGAPGVTVFIRDQNGAGSLSDVMISDRRDPERQMIHSAEEAHLVNQDGRPVLVLSRGMTQVLNAATQSLSLTRYDQLGYDLQSLIPAVGETRQSMLTLSTADLFAARPQTQEQAQVTAGQLIAFGHARFGQPLLGLAAALLGFTPLLLGGYSRFGLRPQMAISVIMVLVLLVLDGQMRSAMRAADPSPYIPYVAGLAGLALAAIPLLVLALPSRRDRKLGVT